MPDRVLIVGAGPTGLTAALELSRLGIPVRIIDKQAAPPTTSRAVGVQARTLELLELRGLADEMVRLGNPGLAASFYGGGKRVFRLDFTRIDSRYHYLLFISQAETERILRTAVEKQGVRIERGVELVGLAQDVLSHDPNPVRVVLRHADGRLEQAQAPWLISAEGAHSTVRATLDLPFEGKTRDEQYALGDLHIDGELAETDLHIFSSEHGFLGLFPMGNRRFRLMASNPLSRPSKDTAPTLQELQAIYDQRSQVPARFRDMSWSSWFRINSRMVARLKVGRLLLGGDAAHIHSPAGAQGMNTGIQDMINLAWKLALVLKGQAPPALLDTYEQERLPVIRDVLAKTEGMTNVIGSGNRSAPGLKKPRWPRTRSLLGCASLRSAIGTVRSPPPTCRRGYMPATACRTCRCGIAANVALAGRKGHCSACSIRPGSRSWPCVSQSRQRPLPIRTMPCSRGALSLALSSWRLRRKQPASDSRQFSAGRTAFSWCARMTMSVSPAASTHGLGSLMRIAACG